MAKIEKEVQKFIRSYSVKEQELWKVTIPDGRSGQIRKQGFLNKSDATRFASQKYLEILNNKGLMTVKSNLLFREYSYQWLEMKKQSDLGEAAKMRYNQEITKRINPFFGHIKIVEIEKFHLRNFISELQLTRAGTSVIRYCVTLFKSIIKQAEIDDVIPSKGITLINTPKHKKKLPRFWDQKESNFFLNATKGHLLHDLWTFTLFTGLRAGEVAGLKWDAIRFDWCYGSYQGAIEVKRTYNQKTRSMQETTKNGDRRVVPVFPEVKELLERRFSKRKGDFVFGDMKPLESSHFNRQLQASIKKLSQTQIPMITFHGLRHSFCSYLDSTGMSRRVVAEIMGHRDLNTTNRYSHVNNQMMGNEVQRWLECQKTQIQQKSNKLELINY